MRAPAMYSPDAEPPERQRAQCHVRIAGRGSDQSRSPDMIPGATPLLVLAGRCEPQPTGRLAREREHQLALTTVLNPHAVPDFCLNVSPETPLLADSIGVRCAESLTLSLDRLGWRSSVLLAPLWLQRWVARRLMSTSAGRRSGLSAVSVLPKQLTMPLRRNDVDPVPALASMRGTVPVARIGRMLGLTVWLVSGYEQARAVLNDSSNYSNDIRPLLGAGAKTSIGGLGFTDAPEHTRLRRLVASEFTGRRLARLSPSIEQIVDQRLDELDTRHGVVDLVTDFAFPIPFFVICEVLGLPDDERERFRDLGRARFDVNGGGGGTFGAMSETRDFLLETVRRQRVEPGDGLIGAIIRAHGDDIDEATLAGLADGVFTGGYETSASMLALGTLTLMRDPDASRLLRNDDGVVDGVVEELLRHLSVVQIAFPRFARHDMTVFGQLVKSGDVVICSLSGANRDTIFGADSDRFVPFRLRRPHLAFGHGLHRCIGAELARIEMRVALRGFARRFPNAALAVEPGALQFRDLSIVYGIRSLPVRLHAPTAAAASANPS